MQQLSVAAIQMASEPHNRSGNLKKAERLLRQAAGRGARLAVLPELFHIGYSYSSRLRQSSETLAGPTVSWMKRMARELGISVGAAINERAPKNHYTTFVLVAAQGETFYYRKRFPAFFERLYFSPGDNLGIFDTHVGRIGVMICWDIAHRCLHKELAGNIDCLLVASAWPDLTRGNWPLLGFGRWMNRFPHHAPAQWAKKLGVPVVFSNLCGEFRTRVPGLPVRYESPFVGRSGVFCAAGNVVERAGAEEQVVVATIHQRRQPQDMKRVA